jgi:hypothetical protein
MVWAISAQGFFCASKPDQTDIGISLEGEKSEREYEKRIKKMGDKRNDFQKLNMCTEFYLHFPSPN